MTNVMLDNRESPPRRVRDRHCFVIVQKKLDGPCVVAARIAGDSRTFWESRLSRHLISVRATSAFLQTGTCTNSNFSTCYETVSGWSVDNHHACSSK